MTRRVTFRQRDIRVAVRALEEAGKKVARVTIEGGKIVIDCGEPEIAKANRITEFYRRGPA